MKCPVAQPFTISGDCRAVPERPRRPGSPDRSPGRATFGESRRRGCIRCSALWIPGGQIRMWTVLTGELMDMSESPEWMTTFNFNRAPRRPSSPGFSPRSNAPPQNLLRRT